MRGKLRVPARPTAEVGSSPTAFWGSPEPRREEEEGFDGRDPPVSDRARGREPACDAGSAWAGLGRG